jgi:uncharacterized protein YbaP (TraB family)
MKRIGALFFLVFTAAIVAYPQENGRFTGTLLWKISGKNRKEASYILGTHHLIAVGAFHLAGKGGFLFQLDKKGYKVKPIK